MKINKRYINLTFITMIVGFMLAIQFQTTNSEPELRDTRDTWQLRDAIVTEQEIQLNLLNEIKKNDQTLAAYQTVIADKKEDALIDTLDQLKEEAGLTEVSGYGVVIKVKRSFSQDIFGYQSISPDLLQKTINILNQYGASHIAIDNHRYVNTSVIRDINGETKIDGYSLRSLPIEILVLDSDKEEAEKMYNKIIASNLTDLYFLENLDFQVSLTEEEITLPAFDDEIYIDNLEPVDMEEGGNS